MVLACLDVGGSGVPVVDDRAMKEKSFASEAELVETFCGLISHKNAPVWTQYHETAGWDLLLVNPAGVQIGIEAKLSLNATMIAKPHLNVPSAVIIGVRLNVPLHDPRQPFQFAHDPRPPSPPRARLPRPVALAEPPRPPFTPAPFLPPMADASPRDSAIPRRVIHALMRASSLSSSLISFPPAWLTASEPQPL
jgi:hypothetical protein